MKDNWKEVKLGELVKLKNGYSFKSDTYDSDSDGKYKIITIKNVTGERYINTSNCNTISDLPGNIRNHQLLNSGDILISMTGNVGRVSLVNEDNCLLNQRVGLLEITDTNVVDREFLFQLLSTDKFQKDMIDRGHGAAQPNIGKDDIESYMVSIPISLEEQIKVAKVLKDLSNLSNTHQSKVDVLTRMKEQLMSNKQGIIEREKQRSVLDTQIYNLESKISKNLGIRFNISYTDINSHKVTLSRIAHVKEVLTYIGEDEQNEREREFNSWN